jgi:predicted transcriptional regulator
VNLRNPESFKALTMLKLIALGEADIKAGRVSDQSEVFARIQARITALHTANTPSPAPR